MSQNYGLIGRHLGHSYSPEIHKQLRGYDYALWPMEPENLPSFFEKKDFNGINVTIPYKQDAMAYCDALGETAKRAGCVNTIVKQKDESLFGDNTDLAGFQFMLRRVGISLAGKHVLILGAGGASLTVQLACADAGAASVKVADKDDCKACPQAQIIVNASPVGMYPNVDASPVSLADYPELEAVADLIYNPRKTRLLQQAEQLNLKKIDGLSMLVAQAAKAAELFTGEVQDDLQIAKVLNELSAQLENWVLIGMPGCGKSTIGAWLAKQSGREFVDLDKVITAREGMPPGEIIAQRGEAAFREIEGAIVKEVGVKTGLVIATGGGAILREDNVQALRQNGRLLWMKRDIEFLATQGRPLSKNLLDLAKKRKSAYQAAADEIIMHNENWMAVKQAAWEAFQ